jgi:phospholipid-binding lipoprotein MlaA
VRIAASPCGAICGVAALLLGALLAGCATPPSDPAERAAFEQNNDPLEPLNRQTLDLNLFLDRILLKPATKVYIAILPDDGRDALKRALDNMKEPVVVINDILQGEPKRAGISAGRFTLNTTLGIVGFLDVATKWGLDKQTGDFGQTLFIWGVPEGPYLVAPLLGPSNPRDLFGMGIDAYMDPFSFLATVRGVDEIEISRFVLDGIDQRARVIDVLDDLQKNSLDFYAQLKSAELRRGEAPEPGANFYQDPNKSPDAQSGTAAQSQPRAGAASTARPAPPKGQSPPSSPRP